MKYFLRISKSYFFWLNRIYTRSYLYIDLRMFRYYDENDENSLKPIGFCRFHHKKNSVKV